MSIETLAPASREEWLALRTKTIGASEIAAILGVHPYATPYQLWASKSGLLPPVEETPAMKRGRILESVALDLLREERPDWIVKANPMPGGAFYRDLAAGVSCTPDAFVAAPEKPAGIAQVKSVQKLVFDKKWKNEDGEVEPPMHVVVQAMQEAALTGAQWACVVALVVDFGIDLHILNIPLHSGIITRLRTDVMNFWRRVAENDPPHPDYGRDGALIAGLYADDDGGTVDLSGNARVAELVAAREALKARESNGTAAAKERKTIDAELVHALGNAACGRLADGRIIEAKTVRRAGFTVEPTSYRAVKIKQGKAA
jgi:putative phage-type endonuclease